MLRLRSRSPFLSHTPVFRSFQLRGEGYEARGLARGDETLPAREPRSEEHTSELQSRPHLVCRLLLEKKKHASPLPHAYVLYTKHTHALPSTPYNTPSSS